MPRHVVARVSPFAPEQLFQLVGDVRTYPEFVPWIRTIRVWNERPVGEGVTELSAEAAVGFAFLKERFATRVRRDALRREIEVGLLSGPFRRLSNRWRFLPHEQGTLIDFDIDFEFRSKVLEMLLETNFDRAVNRLIFCFESRAEALYGRP